MMTYGDRRHGSELQADAVLYAFTRGGAGDGGWVAWHTPVRSAMTTVHQIRQAA